MPLEELRLFDYQVYGVVCEDHEIPKVMSIFTGWGKESKVVADGAKASWLTFAKNANLNKLAKNPLLSIRLYKDDLKACLKYRNGEAHYIEGIKQYFDVPNLKLV